MRVLFVAAENGAIAGAKAGGVGDVIRDVPYELARQGHHVDVVIPDHNFFAQHNHGQLIGEVELFFSGELTKASLYQLPLDNSSSNVRQFVISHPSFVRENGQIYYHDHHQGPFASDASKFALFSLAVCECLLSRFIEKPEVMHLHDWHAGVVSVLMTYEPKYAPVAQIKRVFSIHNIALQGVRPFNNDPSSLEAWFPHLSYDGQQICDPVHLHCFNPMRAGIRLSDKVHVVSPSYCLEVLKPSDAEHAFVGGEGLERDLQEKFDQQSLVGILNGCDYSGNQDEKAELLAFLKLASPTLLKSISAFPWVKSSLYVANERINQWLNDKQLQGPLVTNVGRLTGQKVSLLLDEIDGVTVCAALLSYLAKHQGKLVVIGSGDELIEQQFTRLMGEHDNLLFLNVYDEALSQAAYSMGDLFLMPSLFEPCGISQMIAMKYGQPCLVNAVGGLADTVKHLETGFVFHGQDREHKLTALVETFEQAIDMCVSEPKQYRTIAEQAQAARFSWQNSVQQYIEKLYC